MGKLKDAVLAQTPVVQRSARPATPAKLHAKDAAVDRPADKLTYALKAYTAERRKDGWWIARSWFVAAGEKPKWMGPFETIETACLSIARHLAAELADRHTLSIEGMKLKSGDPLYGLKPETKLRGGQRCKGTARNTC